MGLTRDLYEEMKEDKIVIDYLADLSIATDFYRALCNVDWFIKEEIADDEKIIRKLKGEGPEYWSCTWRTAGGYVAEIRNLYYNKSEDYIDFYCAGDEGTVSDLVRECFDRMGWESPGPLWR